jgi:hypothetical protein
VTDKNPVGLSMENPQGLVRLKLQLDNSDAANAGNDTEPSIIQAADSRLQVPLASKKLPKLLLSNQPSSLEVRFGLFTAEPASKKALPSEFFVELRMENGRQYHARIPINIVTGEQVPRLVLSSDPKTLKRVAQDKMHLRPIPGWRQPYYLFVDNQTDHAVAVTVAVLEGPAIKVSSGTKDAPIKVKAGTSEPVRSFPGSPGPKEKELLPKLEGPLRFQLRDAATDEMFPELTLHVDIASPREYMQVTDAHFLPQSPGSPNLLTVVITPLPGLGDLPCPVQLVLPETLDLFPAFRGQPKEGNQIGVLQPDGRPVTLTAQRIPLNFNVAEDLPTYFYLNVDGLKKADAIERAFWFRTTFRQEGNRQQAKPYNVPRVRFVAEPKFPKDLPAELHVKFAVDNPPPKAKLTFQLSHDEGGQPVPVPGATWTAPAPTDKRLGFDIKGDTGDLLFEASDKDWFKVFRVDGVYGLCRLEARLIDTAGKDVTEPYRLSLELDDRQPQAMGIEAPEQIEKGTPVIDVVASAMPPPTVKDVAFLVGTKKMTEDDFVKAEQDGKTFKGTKVDHQGQRWKAKIKVPDDVVEQLVVTARFKTVAGLTGLYSTEVRVVDLDGAKKAQAKAAMDPPKPGAIKGTVTIAGRQQPDLTVYLLDTDPKNKEPILARVTTNGKGFFEFKDVPVKTYSVYCYKKDEERKDLKPAVIKPGETITVDLDLVQ